MKKVITLGLIVMSLLSFSNSYAQKIGYISADEVIILMPEAARVDTQLNQYQQALYMAAQDKQTAFNEAVAKFYKDSVTMTASVKEVKRTELQRQVQELGGAEQQIQQQFEQKRQELSLPIQRRLQQAIQDVAKENGYTYVLPKEALIVAPPGDDLATLVKRKLNLRDTKATNTNTGTPKTNTSTTPKTNTGAKK